MNEAGVSSGDATPDSIPMASSSACDQNVADKLEPEREQRQLPTQMNKQKATLPIASSIPPTDSPSPDPPTGFTEPPPVPESFPRDPVPRAGKGEGWPYAPQGWPNPDDKWGWRVGKRASANSLWIDRYVSVPVSLKNGKRGSSKTIFASRKSLVEYLKQTFPEMDDPYSIFKAFDWKVPALKNFQASEKPEKRGPSVKRDKPSSMDGEEDEQKSKKQCQAGNSHCLLSKAKGSESELLGRLVYQICCSEPSFCRECKCILCCKVFAPGCDDFSIVRCLNSPVSGQGICGHAAHLECALDSQLAGVIKKNGLDMEYMCRRCDRKTDLRETVSRLVEFICKTATQSEVEGSLELLLRIVQDPEDEARSSEKIQVTLVGALKKVQEGADIVESCKELTKQLHELRSGRSRAIERISEWEDSLHPSKTSLDEKVPQSKSVGSSDARIDSKIISQGGCEVDGVATISDTRAESDLNKDKELPSTSLQDSLKQKDHVLSITTSRTPSELRILLDESMCKPPTLSIEEHIRQCEAMTNRVKCAGQLKISPSTFSVSLPGTLEVVLNSDSKPPSLTGGSLTVESHENRVVTFVAEVSRNTGPPCREELVTSIPSTSRAKSASLFNSQEADEDHVADTNIIEVCEQDAEVEEASIHNACGSFKIIGGKRAMEDSNKTIEISQRDHKMQVAAEPPTISSFDPTLETTQAAGLESEFEEQISEALEKLKRAQRAEYAHAEESLIAQKKIIVEQYEQLENVFGKFAKKENLQLFPYQFKKNKRDKPRVEFDRAMNHLMTQYGKAQEAQKFESMLSISNGFGHVSKQFLQEFFKWPPSDITEV